MLEREWEFLDKKNQDYVSRQKPKKRVLTWEILNFLRLLMPSEFTFTSWRLSLPAITAYCRFGDIAIEEKGFGDRSASEATTASASFGISLLSRLFFIDRIIFFDCRHNLFWADSFWWVGLLSASVSSTVRSTKYISCFSDRLRAVRFFMNLSYFSFSGKKQFGGS